MKAIAIILLCASSIMSSYAQTAEFPFAPAPTVERPLTDAYDYFDDDTQPAYNVSSDPDPSWLGIADGNITYSMQRKKDKTYLFFTCTAQNEWWIFRFDKETALIDTETGDHYIIRGMLHYPLDKFFWIHGPGNQRITFVLEFPPLPKRVKNVIYYAPQTPKRLWWSGKSSKSVELSVKELCKYGELKTKSFRVIR